MAAGLQTDVCIMDFANAFDKVSHRQLLEKLKQCGIDGAANRWIQSFLNLSQVQFITACENLLQQSKET